VISAAERQTFVFADLAGFTAFTEAHGDQLAADAVAEFAFGVRALLQAHGAEEVKTIGDAMMLRAPDAASAVGLGVQIIERVGRRHRALGVRVGVHTGTAVERDGDWFGAAVTLCSRIASGARPGEVVMSAAAKNAAPEELARFDLQFRGRHRFKNVSEPVELYALDLAAGSAAAGWPIDPVCRLAVDPAHSQERRRYRGAELVFCSTECAKVFDRHPARYARRPSASLELRVSDEARERVTERLQRAYRRGRLDQGELERRVEVVLKARTREDLRAVTHDLPRRRGRVSPWRAPFLPLILLGRLVRRRFRRRRDR